MMRILICDDHELFAEGLKAKLFQEGLYCEFALNPSMLKEKISKYSFDIFLFDLNIGGINGFELIKEFRKELVGRIYIISGYDEPYLIEKAKKMQLDGFLNKNIPIEKLISLIHLEKGHSFVYPENIGERKNIPEPIKELQPKAFILSIQEKKIIRLLVNGLSSKEIGEELFISKNTVDTHRRNILRKLEITSTSGLIKFAYENGIVE